jgi:hypothetical protein
MRPVHPAPLRGHGRLTVDRVAAARAQPLDPDRNHRRDRSHPHQREQRPDVAATQLHDLATLCGLLLASARGFRRLHGSLCSLRRGRGLCALALWLREQRALLLEQRALGRLSGRALDHRELLLRRGHHALGEAFGVLVVSARRGERARRLAQLVPKVAALVALRDVLAHGVAQRLVRERVEVLSNVQALGVVSHGRASLRSRRSSQVEVQYAL